MKWGNFPPIKPSRQFATKLLTESKLVDKNILQK
jgi:hypothetical protein